MSEASANLRPPAEEARTRSRENGLKGMQIFLRVSRTCPASATAQGALIAEYCQQTREDPHTLRLALLRQGDLLGVIQATALRVHKQRKKGYVKISLQKVREIIEIDFTNADEMMSLTPEDLVEIYDVAYHSYRPPNQGRGPNLDEHVAKHAETIKEKRKRTLEEESV